MHHGIRPENSLFQLNRAQRGALQSNCTTILYINEAIVKPVDIKLFSESISGEALDTARARSTMNTCGASTTRRRRRLMQHSGISHENISSEGALSRL